MWVKGHQGERGSEKADVRARMEVWMGRRLQKKVIATPAGIKQEYPIYVPTVVPKVESVSHLAEDSFSAR